MKIHRKIGIGALVLGSAVAGGIGLTTLTSASASSPSSAVAVVGTDESGTTAATTDSSSSTDATGTPPADAPKGPHTANGITEEELTGDTATSVEAAVLAEYPDATIDRMETDAEGAAYEAHITLADGSRATVKLDASFAITATETGGPGGGGRGCGPNGAPGAPGERPAKPDASSDTATSDTATSDTATDAPSGS